MNSIDDHPDGQIIDELATPHAVPILLFESKPGKFEELIDAATVGLVDTGVSKFLVTCDHVWRKFQDSCEKNENIVIKAATSIGRVGIRINNVRCIDRYETLDIATLSFDNIQVLESGIKRFYKSNDWPHDPPQKGDLICFAGFPGRIRFDISPNILDINHIWWVDFVDSISDRQIVIVAKNFESRLLSRDPNIKEYNSFGGLSGSPVYVKRKERLEMIGIISAGQKMRDDVILFISPLHYITPNGEIDWSRILF